MSSTVIQREPTESGRFYGASHLVKLRDLGWLRQLSGSERDVLVALVLRADERGTCWPSVATIARDHGLAESTIRQAIGTLTELGLLMVLRQTGKSSRYRLKVPPGAAPARRRPPAPPKKASRQLDADAFAPDSGGPPPAAGETPPAGGATPPESGVTPPDSGPKHASIYTRDHALEEIQATSPCASEDADAHDERDEAEDADALSATPGRTPRKRSRKAKGELPDLPPDIVARLEAIGFNSVIAWEKGADACRRALDYLDLRTAEKDDVENPERFVYAILAGRIIPNRVPERRKRLARQRDIEAARPPEGVRFAEHDGERYEVIKVYRDHLLARSLSTGLQSHLKAKIWPDCTWHLGESVVSGARAADAPPHSAAAPLATYAKAEPSEAERKGALLGRMRAWASLKARTPEQVTTKLEALGLAAEDWEAFLARTAAAARGEVATDG